MKLTETWRENANCAGYPVDIFFQEKKTPITAKTLCAQCSVQADCLEWALRHAESGYFGGMTGEDRKDERRRRKIRLVPIHNPDHGAPYEHGTERCYQYEIRNGYESCQPCKIAHAKYERARNRGHRIRITDRSANI